MQNAAGICTDEKSFERGILNRQTGRRIGDGKPAGRERLLGRRMRNHQVREILSLAQHVLRDEAGSDHARAIAKMGHGKITRNRLAARLLNLHAEAAAIWLSLRLLPKRKNGRACISIKGQFSLALKIETRPLMNRFPVALYGHGSEA